MAENDKDQTRKEQAERNAEIASEMERVGEDPDQAQEGSENLGTQSSESAAPRSEEQAADQDPSLELEDDESDDESD